MKSKREIIKLQGFDKKYFTTLNIRQEACYHGMQVLARQGRVAHEEFWKSAKERYPVLLIGTWIFDSETCQFMKNK